jgi:hypothetical protein
MGNLPQQFGALKRHFCEEIPRISLKKGLFSEILVKIPSFFEAKNMLRDL